MGVLFALGARASRPVVDEIPDAPTAKMPYPWRTTNGEGGVQAMVIKIEIGTCRSASLRTQVPPKEGHPTDALLQIPNHCRDHHLSRSKCTIMPPQPGQGLSEPLPFLRGEAHWLSAGPKPIGRPRAPLIRFSSESTKSKKGKLLAPRRRDLSQ